MASTSPTCPTSSPTTSPRTPTRTSTASAAPGAPARRGPPSRSSASGTSTPGRRSAPRSAPRSRTAELDLYGLTTGSRDRRALLPQLRYRKCRGAQRGWLFEPLCRGRDVARATAVACASMRIGEPMADQDEMAEVPEIRPRPSSPDRGGRRWRVTMQPFIGDGSPARAWADTLVDRGAGR